MNYNKFLSLFVLFYSYNFIYSQSISLGTGSNTGFNDFGPMYTNTTNGSASRYAYIFPNTLLKDLKHGDSIFSLEFFKSGGISISGTCNLKIYIRTTIFSNYGNGNINWVNRSSATGMKKVYDKNPLSEIGNSNGWRRFSFNQPFVVDTTLGENLEILIEYSQSSAQQASIFWSYETNGYSNNQVKFARVNSGTIPDTTNSSTFVHPAIRINFPRLNNFDCRINLVYALGKLPVPLGNPDTVKAKIQNISRYDINNLKVYLESKGSNNYIDSLNYNIKSLEEKTITLPVIYPKNKGLDSIFVKIKNDDNNSNNTFKVYREATKYVYSYRDVTRPLDGGIGFVRESGDFVARFYCDSVKNINQITVNFSTLNIKCKIGIWAADGPNGLPNTLIWQSDTITSAPTFISPVLPFVSVSGYYYVGVRQIGTQNVGFGFQFEDPVRENTFFYKVNQSGAAWTDFAPDAPFKFAIEPRIQTIKDVAPIKFEYPRDTINLNTVKTMAPRATIFNYGSQSQTTAFNTTMQIKRFNSTVYTSTKSDTLSTGLKRTIKFDSTFLPSLSGDYDVTIITKLSGDELKDNDTLKSKLVVANYKDVGPATIFDPSNGTEYEQFVDTIYPTCIVQNYGLDKQGPFNVKVTMYDSFKNVVFTESKPLTLNALQSSIVFFSAYPCSVTGSYKCVFTTDLNVDIKRKNDTSFSLFKIIRSNDVAVTQIHYPGMDSVIKFPVVAKNPSVEIENFGTVNQAFDFPVYFKIFYKDSLIYFDSTLTTSFRLNPNTIFFKNFTTNKKGYYTMMAYTNLDTDQFRLNDTLKGRFSVDLPDDVQPLSSSSNLVFPELNSQVDIGKVYAPKVYIRNNGFVSQVTPFPVVFMVKKGNVTEYLSIKNVQIDNGQTQRIVFDSTFILNDTNRRTVLIYTALPNDYVKKNDTIRGFYYGKNTYDVGVSNVIIPKFNDSLLININPILPKITVTNFGDSVKGVFRTTVKIINKANNNVLYNEFKDSSFGSLKNMDLRFPIFNALTSNTNLELIAYTNYSFDQNKSNDTFIRAFKYLYLYDLKAQQIVNPLQNSKIKNNANSFQPQVSIKNNGPMNFGNGLATLTIKLQNQNNTETEVYNDTLNVPMLSSNTIWQGTLNKQFNPASQALGKYKAYLKLFTNIDQIDSNNNITNEFEIIDYTSVYLVENNDLKIFPNPSNHELNVIFNNKELFNSISLYDMNGKLLFENNSSYGDIKINTSEFSSGIYSLKINHKIYKITIQH